MKNGTGVESVQTNPNITHNNLPLLRVRGLSKNFYLNKGLLSQLIGQKAQVVKAVDNIDFEIQRREILGLVGESGSGKTTVGRLITRLEEPTSGQIMLDGEDISVLSTNQQKRFRSDVQMIFQNPYESVDPRYTVGDWVGRPIRILGTATADKQEQAIMDMLGAVGLRPAQAYRDRFAHELSGGQRQRIDIARALVVNPKMIVADEPTSMLDVSVRSGIIQLILKLRNEMDVAYLFISHDLAIARYVSDRIAVMYKGKIVEIGPTDTVVHQAAHPYTHMLIQAVPEPNPRKARQNLVSDQPRDLQERDQDFGCRFRARCPFAKDICAQDDPQLLTISTGQQVACHFAEEVQSIVS